MHSDFLADTLTHYLELPDDPAGGTDARAEFATRFAVVLQRLERNRRVPHGEAEVLMSALGAAQVKEWELALALLDSSHRAQPGARRLPASLGMLRRRFQLVMSVAAVR